LIGEVAFCQPIREALKKGPLDLSRLNLASCKPKLTRGFLLMVEAEYDAFVPADTTKEMWQAWGNPELWSLPHGHITVLGSSSMFKRAVKWISLRMRVPEWTQQGIRPDQNLS
jgi:hypothetical protein